MVDDKHKPSTEYLTNMFCGDLFPDASADISGILDEYKSLTDVSEVTMWLKQHREIHPTTEENAIENEGVDTKDEKELKMKSKEELEFVENAMEKEEENIKNEKEPEVKSKEELEFVESVKVSYASLNIAPHMQQGETIGEAMQRLKDVSFSDAVVTLASEVGGTPDEVSLLKKEDLEL